MLDLTLADVCLGTGAADGAAGTRLECRGCSASSTNVLRSRSEHSHLYLNMNLNLNHESELFYHLYVFFSCKVSTS